MSADESDVQQLLQNECGGLYCSEEHGHVDCLYKLITDITGKGPEHLAFVGSQTDFINKLREDFMKSPATRYEYYLWCPASKAANGLDWWIAWRIPLGKEVA